MKKIAILLSLVLVFLFAGINQVIAQGDAKKEEKKEAKKEEKKEEKKEVKKEGVEVSDEATKATVKEEAPVKEENVAKEERSLHQSLKQKFIEGGWPFMLPILVCLIGGLAVALARIITLSLSSTNVKKLVIQVEDSLKSGNVEGAKELLRNTRGPVASIFVQGLMRLSEGIEMVEKSVIAYGSVEMNKLERGLVWISLAIALAPMLGFFGTVVGMIEAFDNIEAAGDISPSLVAGGIKIALITTVAGLIVAMILQVFYNYLVSRVDSIVAQMEEASISLIDLLIENNLTNK
ncbi:MAG TPA: flagellar motor protein MotA [Microscillaceae bacterium]|nr:flagellar motor protein MotA [Microscillaceae bacterium]